MNRHHILGLLLLLCLSWTQTVCAWSNAGHRITGLIAEPQLTLEARRQTRLLLGEEGLDVAATFMDTQRGLLQQRWPEADRWHYDNIPVCQSQPHCLDGHCATQQIERFRKILSDPRNSQAERALALRILVHLLGDIHQPLHMADNSDRGGNNLQVRLYAGDARQRLHEVFDSTLIKQLQGALRLKEFAALLQQRYRNQLPQWRTGTLTAWAAQSHVLAKNRVYAQLPGFACGLKSTELTVTLTDSYLNDAKRYLPEQLVKAGVRIAQVLNDTLK